MDHQAPAVQPLHVLLLEDSELDAELVLAELEDGGFACEAARVDSEEAFTLGIQDCPDLILADYSLPAFDGISALKLAARHCPEVPFLFVSGALGEELAIETLKQGATDYVLKHRLERLVPSVRRALREAEMRRERQRLETELRNRAELLAEADRRKDQFLAVLAHELRNPLAPIFNALYAMRISGDDPQVCCRSREVVERQVRHMSRLLDDLLDISRITRGKILLRQQPLDLAQLVRETVEDHRDALVEAGLTLHLEVPEKPVLVSGDRTRLAQVTGNLLSNSRKFTPAGGCISVTLFADAEYATLSIRDTGVGIDPTALDTVFEPFAQEDRSRHSENAGLGLGLALVKGLMELHEGCVSVRSAGPGMGAEFICRLPLLIGSDVRIPEQTAGPRIREGLRVLVIDDNRDVADTVAELLQMHGAQVEVAYTGIAGLDVMQRLRPEVVLCDLGLPDIDGFTVAQRIRGDREAVQPQLIAVSGYGREEDRRRAHEAGFDIHLTKPVDPEVLHGVLAQA